MQEGLNIQADGVLLNLSGYSDEEIQAHDALVAQLTLVRNLINQLEDHPHFTDDCGEYLSAALELAHELTSARENGIEDLLEKLQEMARLGQEEGGLLSYATDGVSPVVYAWGMNHGMQED